MSNQQQNIDQCSDGGQRVTLGLLKLFPFGEVTLT